MKTTKKRAAKKEAALQLVENALPSICPVCGMDYRDMRTGETFESVQDSMFVTSEDPERWRQKGRHSVLGFWHEIKQSIWRDHLAACAEEEERGGYEEAEYEYQPFDESDVPF